MTAFPYFEILKAAFDYTRRSRWLWVFGLFIGSAPGINFWWVQILADRPRPAELERAKHLWENLLSWIASHSAQFSGFVAAGLGALLALVILSGLSKAAVIWAASHLSHPRPDKPVNFRKSVKTAGKYFWQIIGLGALVTAAFFLLLAILALPIAYLFFAGAPGRALVLLLLGIAIFLPASIVMGFLHLFGPIFIVVYGQSVGRALQHAFNLVRRKLLSIIILAGFLAGLTLLFALGLLLGIVILSLPLALLALGLSKLGMVAGVTVVLAVNLFLVICYTIVLGAAFAVFQNIVWVLAVSHLVRTLKSEEKAEKAFAPEPA